jgi:hypothetical protein
MDSNMVTRNHALLFLLLIWVLSINSCAINEEKNSVTGPLQLTKPLQSPGAYAYRRFDDGPFRNLIEVFDLSSRESLGTVVPSERQEQRVLGFAIAPREPKGIITIHQVPGILYIFDLQQNHWRSIVLQRAPLGYAVLQSNQPRAWLIDTATPAVLEVDLDSEKTLRKPNLNSFFDVLLPYMAISADNQYLAVIGNSGIDGKNKINLNSLAILDIPTSKITSTHRLGNYPVNPVFSRTGRYICTQLMFERSISLVDRVNQTDTVLSLPIHSQIAPTYDFFSIEMHPSENVLVASLYDLSNPQKGPLDLLVVFDLEQRAVRTVAKLHTTISELCFDPDGSLLYAATPAGLVALDVVSFDITHKIESCLEVRNIQLPNPQTLPGDLIIQYLR